VILGTEGSVSSYDYDDYVTVQTRKKPVPHVVAAPATKAPHQNPVQYLLHCLDKNVPLEGPVSLPISRIGQEIVDAAVKSAQLKKAVKLA
jgi:glucose-fructose oxidoreductase